MSQLAKRRKPFNFPLTFNELLRYLMPQKRPEDRMRFFREYTVSNIITEKWFQAGMQDNGSLAKIPRPTDDEISQILNRLKARTFEERDAELILTEVFTPWFIQHTRGIRKKRAKAAAAGRWKKGDQPLDLA